MTSYAEIQQKFEDGYRLEAAELLYILARAQFTTDVDEGHPSEKIRRADFLAGIVRAMRNLGDSQQLQEFSRLREVCAVEDAEFAEYANRFQSLINDYVESYKRLLELTDKKTPLLKRTPREDLLRCEIMNQVRLDVSDCELDEYRLGRLQEDMQRLTSEAQSLTTTYRFFAHGPRIREGFGLEYERHVYTVEILTREIDLIRKELLRLRAGHQPPPHPGYTSHEEYLSQELAKLVQQI